MGYIGAVIVESACIRLPLPRSLVGVDGLVTDAGVREQIAGVLRTVMHHVNAATPS